MHIALVGNGRMSRSIAALAVEQGHAVTTVITGAENRSGLALTADRLAGAEVVLEFTRPEAAADNLLRLAGLGARVVCGTTGWLGRLPEVEAAVRQHRGALLHSPNFSTGVQLFLRAARDLAARLADRAEFDGFIVESHHGGKRDAPSGTAARLQGVARAADRSRGYPISSLRGGHDPGGHRLVYDTAHETIQLTHQARGRQVFAAGALAAAEWLRDREGVFTFEAMLFGEDS